MKLAMKFDVTVFPAISLMRSLEQIGKMDRKHPTSHLYYDIWKTAIIENIHLALR